MAEWCQGMGMIALPLCVVASFPARLALDAFSWRTLIQLAGLAGFFFALVVLIWRTGLRSYSSASS